MTQDELAKMQLDNKSLKNELDRILDLYKQLEFEQNLQNKIDRLNELAQQQKQLGQQSKDKNAALNDINKANRTSLIKILKTYKKNSKSWLIKTKP